MSLPYSFSAHLPMRPFYQAATSGGGLLLFAATLHKQDGNCWSSLLQRRSPPLTKHTATTSTPHNHLYFSYKMPFNTPPQKCCSTPTLLTKERSSVGRVQQPRRLASRWSHPYIYSSNGLVCALTNGAAAHVLIPKGYFYSSSLGVYVFCFVLCSYKLRFCYGVFCSDLFVAFLWTRITSDPLQERQELHDHPITTHYSYAFLKSREGLRCGGVT